MSWLMGLAIFALVFIAIAPTLIDPDERQTWFSWLVDFFTCRCCCFWTSLHESSHHDRGARYVLSAEQEEEIRDAFLQDRLEGFTMTLDASHVILTKDNHTSSESSDENSIDDGESLGIKHHSKDSERRNETLDIVIETNLVTDSFSISEAAKEQEAKLTLASRHNSDDVEHGSIISTSEIKQPEEATCDDSSSLQSNNSSHVNQKLEKDEEDSDPSFLPAELDVLEDDFHTIMVPPAGQPYFSDDDKSDTEQPHPPHQYRSYSNGCPICLSPFVINDQVSWSHNPHCSHVFHTTCIHEWLSAAGRRHVQRQRRLRLSQQQHGIVLRQDPITTILQMPLICPCCRQYFLLNDDEAKRQQQGKKRRETPATSATGDIETAIGDVEEGTNPGVRSSTAVVEDAFEQSLTPPSSSNDTLSIPEGDDANGENGQVPTSSPRTTEAFRETLV